MSELLGVIKALPSSLPAFPSLPSQQEQDEAYLADSCDVYELEWRMRELASQGPALGRHIRPSQTLRDARDEKQLQHATCHRFARHKGSDI